MATNYGKWIRVEPISGTFYATGSAYQGANGLMVDSAAAGTVSFTEANAAGSGSVDLSDLNSGVIYEFSIHYISMSAGSGYVFYKNPIAHF